MRERLNNLKEKAKCLPELDSNVAHDRDTMNQISLLTEKENPQMDQESIILFTVGSTEANLSRGGGGGGGNVLFRDRFSHISLSPASRLSAVSILFNSFSY